MVVEPFEDTTTTTLVSSFGMKGDQETASNMKSAAKMHNFLAKTSKLQNGFPVLAITGSFLRECIFRDSRI